MLKCILMKNVFQNSERINWVLLQILIAFFFRAIYVFASENAKATLGQIVNYERNIKAHIIPGSSFR